MTVKIKKQELLDVVKANLAKHAEIVQEAFAKYREQAIAELDSMIAEAKAGKRIRRFVNLVEPVDQTREYQKAIKQIEMHAEDLIELGDLQFQNYVLDQWQWSENFKHSNRTYSAKVEED